MVILNGGPFDGQIVEPRNINAKIPDWLGFNRNGRTIHVQCDARDGVVIPLDEWQIRDPRAADQNRQKPDGYSVGYRNTGRTTPEGNAVFEFDSE